MTGIDTIGGVRVPAAFCGIFGFRTSQGALSNVGIIPVSPSLDAVGMCLWASLPSFCCSDMWKYHYGK